MPLPQLPPPPPPPASRPCRHEHILRTNCLRFYRICDLIGVWVRVPRQTPLDLKAGRCGMLLLQLVVARPRVVTSSLVALDLGMLHFRTQISNKLLEGMTISH